MPTRGASGTHPASTGRVTLAADRADGALITRGLVGNRRKDIVVERRARGAVPASPVGDRTPRVTHRQLPSDGVGIVPHDQRPSVETLVTEHLPLVGHIARETASRMPRHLGTDDLVGAGSLALVQAAHAYDPSLGVPFARFANTRIRGAMIDQMRQRDWASRSLRSRARALSTAADHLTTALGRAPDDTELATAAGLSEAEIREVRSGTDRATLLTLDPLATDGDGLGSTLADPAPRPEDALIAAERMGYLRDAVSELPERLRIVVSGYYLQQRPLTEIATELGITQSRASQLRSEGLDLLREALETLLGEGVRVGAGDGDGDGQRPAGVTPSGRAAGHALPGQFPGQLPGQAAGYPSGQVPAQAAAAGTSSGVRARRREAYVDAVARRSATGQRANVQAYLDGNTLDSALL